ncbi:MAG: energy transducer TonB [Spirochaetaceae bacterium]|nr:MAG: energy transducer TonB [Spirochaetaceae bacterium]
MGMDVHEKERLGIGIAVALILHIGIFVGLSAHDWSTELPEYTGPVIVELESSFVPLPDPPEPEPVTEPEPELDMSEPAPQPEDLQTPAAEEAPSAPPTQPAPTPPAQTQPTPSPRPSPAPAPSPRPAPTPAPVDPLAQAPTRSQAEIEAEIRGERLDPAPERARPERDFAPGDVLPDDSPGELPEWVRSIEERGISTAEMDSRDLQQVAQRIERDPEFEATLRRVIAGVEAAARDGSTSPGTGDTGSAGEPSPDGIAGDPGTADGSAAITGLRQGRGTPEMEFSFTAQELSALPPTVTIVVAFDVLPSGQVGSLMFVRRSGYTPVDQRVADRIRRWSFSRIAGTQTETGYFTLVISREDVTR